MYVIYFHISRISAVIVNYWCRCARWFLQLVCCQTWLTLVG